MSSNNKQQTTGPGVITSPTADTRSFDHRGTQVGSSNVTLAQNDTGRLDSVVEWTIPKKYRMVGISGGKHWTKAELRSKETFDGDGSTTTFSLSEDLVAIAGEPQLEDQPFPVVVAYDTDASSQLTVSDVDYSANEVTFASAPNTGTDNVAVWPIMGEGVVQYRGLDAFDNLTGPLENWGVPIHVFADNDQNKNTMQVHLPGAARFEREEVLAFNIDAPRQVVWEDADYPEGDYVSTIEQRVDVEL